MTMIVFAGCFSSDPVKCDEIMKDIDIIEL
jgi:hypothetical protein